VTCWANSSTRASGLEYVIRRCRGGHEVLGRVQLERHADFHPCFHADIGALLMAMASKSPRSAFSTIFSDLWWTLVQGALRPFIRDIEDLRYRQQLLYRVLVGTAVVAWLAGVGAISVKLVYTFFGNRFAFPPIDYLGRAWMPLLISVSVWLLAGRFLKAAVELQSDTEKAVDFKRVVDDPSFRQVEIIKKERDRLEEKLFESNLKDRFVVQSLQWRGVRFFESGVYRFAPRVNVLLGKNGYGKTLLLRTFVALLQRDVDCSAQIFATEPARGKSVTTEDQQTEEAQPLLTLEVVRNGSSETITRDATYFADKVGKIPVLAIPDSRFVNRSVRTVGSSATGAEPLARSGARHFLSQEPYESVIQELLSQLCLEFLKQSSWRTGKGFDRPIFRLIEDVVRRLTEDEEFAFDTIRESGRTAFEILVRTAGNRDVPLPIQYASQGTLSVVAIFGLIYSFLRSLQPEQREDEVLMRTAIVLIDEVDAHLHPKWQQSLIGLLTSKFPSVQFIVSAHSPLIVSGCDSGEVSVLRRSPEPDRFMVKTLGEDFLGAEAGDLYKRLFDIEDSDRLYNEYSMKATMSGQNERERAIESLAQKERRTAQEEEKLKQLISERRLIGRAADVRENRLKAEASRAYVTQLEMEVEKLKLAMRDAKSEGRSKDVVP
jgi:hypothetical protein